MPSSEPPLEFFIDRSLGRYVVPEMLRAVGRVVHTLADVFGSREQFVEDEEWLAAVGRESWVVLTKDRGIRRRPVQLAAIQRFKLRVFAITSGSLTGSQQGQRFIDNLALIEASARRERGPYVYAVYESALRRLWPPS